MILFDYIKNQSITNKDFIILEDEINKPLSFYDLEIISGKIYHYLLDKEFNKEEIIVIRLKRSYFVYLAMLGIWKRGLPFVVIGEASPKEYIDQVLKETNNKYIFNEDELDKALKCDYIEGYKEPDVHDLACVVYSTGSSGFFKGSMHEFGSVITFFNIYQDNLRHPVGPNIGFAKQNLLLITGMYSISCITNFLCALAFSATLIIVSLKHAIDDEYLINLCNKKNIYSLDCSPKNINKYINADIPSVKELALSFEMSSVKYNKTKPIDNYYGLTESFGSIGFFTVDKDYDICPIAYISSKYLFLLDKKDNKITSSNKIGEIAFSPHYLRGYLCHQDLFYKVFYNGYFHTGDLGYINEDGNYVCIGRKKDILELDNDKYIVPIFIDIAIKKHFKDISECCVKIFKDEPTPMVVLYYVSSISHTLIELNNVLKDTLPSYSLLTHIEKIDELPYFFCGKINKNLLNKPIN